MPPWAAHGVVSRAESTWVLLHGVGLEGETREKMGLGWRSPLTETHPEGLGRRTPRLCTPLPRPCLPQTGNLALGSVSTVAQSRFHNQVTAFKGRGAWMCFVGWDQAAVAGPYFGTCTLCISA